MIFAMNYGHVAPHMSIGILLAETMEEMRQQVSFRLVPIEQDGNTVTTYVTDGSGELHCFEELEAGTYQVQIFPTADYVVTGDDSWAVAIAEGVMLPVSFGLQVAPEGVADAGEEAADSTEDAAATEQNTSGGLSGNIGIIVLAVAAVLIVLAGAGVYLLRRG